MKNLGTILILLLSLQVTAQSFNGTALYQSKRVVDIKIDSKGMGGTQQDRIQEMLKKQFEKVYELHFNQTASLYFEQEKLEAHAPNPTGDIQIMIGGGSANRLYKDIKNASYLEKEDLMGKLFLVSGTLKPLAWKLEKEAKKIGNYTCYKASAVEEYEDRDFKTDSITLKTRRIIAWYTPEIPVSHPEKLVGLPGLILEVAKDKQLLLCTKIILNPVDAVAVEKPKKGKRVSQKEFDVITAEKTKEMMKRFNGGRKKAEETKLQ